MRKWAPLLESLLSLRVWVPPGVVGRNGVFFDHAPKSPSFPRLEGGNETSALFVIAVRPLRDAGEARVATKHLLPREFRRFLLLVGWREKFAEFRLEEKEGGLGVGRVEIGGRCGGGKLGSGLEGGLEGVKEGKGSERREAAAQGQKTGVFLDE